jgi:hypothetical protein
MSSLTSKVHDGRESPPPRNAQFAADIYRFTDGKISEEWAADDIAAIIAQVGAFNPLGN